MRTPTYKQIWQAMRHLSPSSIRDAAGRPVTAGILASSQEAYREMRNFLEGAGRNIIRAEQSSDLDRCDFGLAEPHLPCPPRFYPFEPDRPNRAIERVLAGEEDLWLALARQFPAFRPAVMERLILKVSLENALIAVATALPNVVPSLLQLPWALGEFASDTAILTLNQIRLTFLLAAATDAPVGYREHRTPIATIVASAFGWRALARELVSKMPLGAGVLPKGVIAFAGTYVVGLGLERYLRTGSGLSRDEARVEFDRAYQRGRELSSQWRTGNLRKTSA